MILAACSTANPWPDTVVTVAALVFFAVLFWAMLR